MTLQEMILVFQAVDEDKEITIGFQLHTPLRKLAEGFLSYKDAAEALQKFADAGSPIINDK